MGTGNSLITVTLDKTQPSIYFAGEIISGEVHFNITERTTKIDEIYLSLTGDIGYMTTRPFRMQNGQIERKTEYHDIRILGQKLLLGRPIGTNQMNHELNQNDSATLDPGHYKHPFSIQLPDNLPPTLHPEDYPFVRYQLQVLIEKKWYHPNDRHSYPIRIYPRVNLLHISNSQTSVKFGTRRKDIAVKGMLQHAGLLPGQQTMIFLDIQNPTRIQIKRIDVCFIQRYEIEECRRRSELIRFSVPELNNNHEQRTEAKCSLIIPTGIPPTFSYRSKGTRPVIRLQLYYDLKLEVKAKGLFTDFELQVPVIVGTDSAHSATNDGLESFSNEMNILSLNIDDDEIPPPSYESIIHKDELSN